MRGMKDPLQEIPGVGKAVAADLREMGFARVSDLRGADPEELYERHCAIKGMRVDRCMLYTFRCAVYYAEGGRDAEKLKWWNWKEGSGV